MFQASSKPWLYLEVCEGVSAGPSYQYMVLPNPRNGNFAVMKPPRRELAPLVVHLDRRASHPGLGHQLK